MDYIPLFPTNAQLAKDFALQGLDHLAVPKIREGPQYRPQNTIILNIGQPQKIP